MIEKILITGGAGYLGNVLTRKLLKEGYEVHCLDNLMYNQGPTILSLVDNPNFHFTFGDVRNLSLIEKLVKKVDTIIPLAAIVGAPACERNPSEAKSINCNAVIQLNEIRSSDQKLIFPNTNSGYGVKDSKDYCTEEDELNPISIYGETKCQAEQALLGRSKKAITLRLATVFGISPRMRRDLMVNDFVYKALTDKNIVLFEPEFMRNFVSINDVAEGFLHVIKNYESMKGDSLRGECYNLGNDRENMSKKQLAEKVKQHIPSLEIYLSEKGKDPDKRNYIVSSKKIEETGFKAETSIDEGIRDLIKAYNILLSNIPYTNL